MSIGLHSPAQFLLCAVFTVRWNGARIRRPSEQRLSSEYVARYASPHLVSPDSRKGERAIEVYTLRRRRPFGIGFGRTFRLGRPKELKRRPRAKWNRT